MIPALPPRRRRLYWVTATVALGAPLSAALLIGHATDALAAKLSAKAGEPAHIGGVDVDLTGEVRVSDVAIGTTIAAETIETAVGSDTISIANPRVEMHVDADGDSDLARLARRLAPPAAHRATAHRSTRRIVVDSGQLVAHVAGVGDVTADGVELVPNAAGDGIEIVTGAVHVHGASGPATVDLAFARAAAEVALPSARVGRVLAVGGSGTVALAGPVVTLHDVAAGRLDLTQARALELRATIDDAGAARPISASLQLASGDGRDLAVALEGDRVPLAALATLAAPYGLGTARARATGTLVVRRTHNALELDIHGTLADATLEHASLAPAPLAVTASLRGTLALAPEAIAFRDAQIVVGAADLTASGWLRRAQPLSGQLDVALARAPCTALLESLPAALRGPLDGMTLAGDLDAGARLAIDLAAPDGDGVQLAAHFGNSCRVTDEPPAADVRALAGPVDTTFPDGSRARTGPGLPGWIAADQIPPRVANAFVSAEDGRFREHRGFDATQIARSLEIDLREHRLARGGSTISQQLVKNAFLTQRRSLDRKIQEAILTWRLEDRLSKKQILERYLNIIELGPHVYGIGAAAKHWFAAAPKDLSIHQAAFLAALTSEPTSMTKRVRGAGGIDPDTAARVDTILRAMKRDGAIGQDEMLAARSSPMQFAPSALAPEN